MFGEDLHPIAVGFDGICGAQPHCHGDGEIPITVAMG